MLLSERLCIYLAMLSLVVKMAISPLATGDYQIASFRLVNYACDAGILFSVLLYLPYTYKAFLFIHSAFWLLLFFFVLSTLMYTNAGGGAAISQHLKVYLPLLFFSMLASYFHRNKASAIGFSRLIAIITAFLLVLGLLILPVSMNRMEVWWPSYFGGLHTTAYMAMAVLFISYAFVLNGRLSGRTFVVISALILLCIFFGWGVRTAASAIVLLIFFVYLRKVKLGNAPLLLLSFPLMILGMIFILVFVVGTDEFDYLTSGRISMYQDKFKQLAGNSMINWLIGNGAGSDLIETDIWWWAAKGAHSDLLTFLVEGGVGYLLVTLAVIVKIYKLLGKSEARFFLFVFVFTSTFSNGYFTRTLPAYVFLFSLALAFAFSYAQQEQLDEK